MVKTIQDEAGRVRSLACAVWPALQEKENSAMFAKRKGVEVPDLDELMPSEAAEKIEDHHRMRYRVPFPPEAAPADALTSRCHKELDQRLQGEDIWSVKTLACRAKLAVAEHHAHN